MVHKASSDILSHSQNRLNLGINAHIDSLGREFNGQDDVSQNQIDILKQRLWRMIVTELDFFEQKRANRINFKNIPTPELTPDYSLQTRLHMAKTHLDMAREGESAAQTLLLLTNAFTLLRAHKVPVDIAAAPVSDDNLAENLVTCDDDPPRELHTFKQELAQCLNHICQQRHAAKMAEKT